MTDLETVWASARSCSIRRAPAAEGRPGGAAHPKAFDLLTLLVARSGHLLSKDELIEKLWPGTFVEEANLAYNVSAIRKALGDGSETERYIETVPRRGYRFVGPVAPRATGAHEQPHGADGASGQDGREPPTGPTGRTHLWLAWTVAAIASIGLIGLAVVHFRETATIRGDTFRDSRSFETWSPARSRSLRMACSWRTGVAGTDGIVRLWVRDLSTLEPRSLSGTSRTSTPFFRCSGRPTARPSPTLPATT